MSMDTSKPFYSKHLVQFYETDLMGIVHHSNYLRFMEEARVAWAHHHGLIDYQTPQSASKFAVLETQVKHLKPAFFGDQLMIVIQAQRVGQARVRFQYKVLRESKTGTQAGAVSQAGSANQSSGFANQFGHERVEVLCAGQTTHVALDSSLKPMKIPTDMKNILEKELWTETWLSNSSE